MGWKATFMILLVFIMSSCDLALKRTWDDKKLRNKILGDWERIAEEDTLSTNPPPPSTWVPDGMTNTKDSIDLYLGFFKQELDTITKQMKMKYLGSKLPYKTIRDSIFVRNPLDGTRIFMWKFVDVKNDTLFLKIQDNVVLKYKRREPIPVDNLGFDQVIYSSSGCYGSCPIVDVSIDNMGNVLFQGEGYVDNLGFYRSELDVKTKKHIFNKFREAAPMTLHDNYSTYRSDGQSITTTFIKNGRIVKTIQDYEREAPKELIWAYTPIAHLYSQIPLVSIAIDELFYPKLHYFAFKKPNYLLPLEKSESFYLWTVLRNAKKTTQQFKPVYDLSFIPNYTYWGPDPNETQVHKYTIKSITTDGQFFKFDFEKGKTITYDLGYNFVERNFKGINHHKLH